MPTIGVLALQGDFREHAARIESVGARAVQVRRPAHLDGLDGLILPGGESTTIARLLLACDLHAPIQALGRDGFPLWGTCAGAILLADDVPDLDRPTLALFPMTVRRNAYGRQVDSFEADLPAPALGGPPLRAIFIRAPRIRRVGAGVETLLALDGEPVAVRHAALLATTFHPELSADTRLLRYFLDRCTKGAQRTPAEETVGTQPHAPPDTEGAPSARSARALRGSTPAEGCAPPAATLAPQGVG